MIIAGKLTTSVGSAVQWATITFDPAIGPSISFTTDNDGNYSYEVPAGTYRVFSKGKYDINQKLLGENITVASSGTMSLESLLDMGVPSYTVATLPDPASLDTGTQAEVVDCGGNIATVVAGAWRFEYPFRTTWANRPPVNLVPAGTELQVTDYANQKWISDGINWRPAQGRAIITQQHGNTTQPLATLSGITQGYFTIPGGNPIIKGGMILHHSRVYIEILVSNPSGITISS